MTRSRKPRVKTPKFLRAKPRPLEAVPGYLAGKPLSPAVVCEVGWVNGLGAIRSLGRGGIPTIALDHRSWALGFRSRYALPVVAPEPLVDERGFIDFLFRLADVLGRPAPIFPTHDEHLNSLARHKDDLGDRYRYPFPGWDVLERLQSKREQLAAAEQIGVATPLTAHPRSADEARRAAREVGYPVFVKPSENVVFKRIYRRQAFVCATEIELDQAYALTAEYEPMLQEFVPGGDEYLWTYGSYVAADGTVLGRFSGRKLRQTRESMGSARVGEALWDDEVVQAGAAMLRELGFHGVSQVEFKRDPRTGVLKLIEVNPRLWQWHGLSAECGVDLTRIAYHDLLGERPGPLSSGDCGKRWSITLMAPDTAFQRPPYVDAVFAPDDAKPGLVHGARFALELLHLR